MPATALTTVHKFIRSELFDVSHALSRAGQTDVEAVNKKIREVTNLLHEHAAHEESGFEPQLRVLNAAHADRLLEDHHRLHEQLDRINSAAKNLDDQNAGTCVEGLRQLYLDWNRFVAGYLMHLDDEERTLFAVGGHLIPPLEAMAAMAVSQGEEEGEAFLQTLYAVIAPEEREVIERARSRAAAGS